MMYFIQVILYTAMMLLIYLLFLRNRPFHQLSRYYLLSSGMVPPLIPLVRLPDAWQATIQNNTMLQIRLPEVLVSANAAKQIDTSQASTFVYISITLLFLGWHVWHMYKSWSIIKNNKNEVRGEYQLITGSGYGPGSFGRYIIFPNEEVNTTILAHEQAHVRLRHTDDLVALNLLQTVFWPNLLLVWIKKEIKQVHEFQADAHMPVSKDEYAALLLSSVFNTQSLPTMHLFIIHPIKRRIMMLQKNCGASPMKAALLVGATLSLFLIAAIGIQSCAKKRLATATNETDSVPNTTAPGLKETALSHDSKNRPNPDKDGIYSHVEKMPESSYDIGKFLQENLVYPKYAIKKKIEGRVLVKFIVKEDGQISDVTIVRSPDESLSDEALRVVHKMSAWTPGEQEGKKVAVYYVLPIVFKLS